jgi:predicted outer membrane repeat protein
MNSDRMNLVSVIVAALLLPVAGAQAVVRYVALDGAGTDGLSWATAYNSIQQAIDDPLMVGGGEIWVKQGVYYLTQSIEVTKAVRIYGGYSGSGSTRDWEIYQTSVSGDGIAYHCFYVTGNATIDGFAILGGSGLGTLPGGGGVAVVDRTATISNCLIQANRIPGFGAGIATYTADGTKIINCTFSANAAGSNGGAIYNEESADVLISGCTFVGNSANDSGGAIYSVQGSVTITGCLFQNNKAGTGIIGVAGAVLNEETTATISNCTFMTNEAPHGAGIFSYASDVSIEGCWFAKCSVNTLGGGGVYNNGGSVAINSCLFQENVVSDQGGAITTTGTGGAITNCILYGNRASGGGAIYIGASQGAGAAGTPQFINCTIFNNSASMRGGAVYSADTPSTFANCIIWGNSAATEPGIYSEVGWSAGRPAAHYCDIEGSSTYPGTGNIRSDPLLVNPSGGDFSLSFDSPCLDTGNNADVVAIPKDYEDAPRVVDGDGNGSVIVDMGASELQTSAVHLIRGEIMRGVSYDNPSDSSATYVFTLRLTTDETISSIEFRPAGGGDTWYQIPNDEHTSSGYAETYHEIYDRTHVWGYWVGAPSASALAPFGDGTYDIIAHYRNGAQAQMQVAYLVPGNGGPIPQPTQRPQITAPAYDATAGSPVTISWNPCTDSLANSIYVTVNDAATGEDVVGEVLATSAALSSPHVLSMGTYEGEVGFANLYDNVAGSDGTPFRCGKAVFTGLRFTVPFQAVYRFWNQATDEHFYTAKESEKDKLIEQYADVWTFEGVAFNASSSASDPRMLPVYRFWSGTSHFYTIDETEKNKLINQYANVWQFEGIVFYAYPEGAEPPECKAVYRFWNVSNGTHFFTIKESEATKLMTQYSNVYTYEGVAFYAYPP